jgi:hypothetical protein
MLRAREREGKIVTALDALRAIAPPLSARGRRSMKTWRSHCSPSSQSGSGAGSSCARGKGGVLSDEPQRSQHASQETLCEDDGFLSDFELDADDGSLWGHLLPSETRWLDPHLVEPRAHRIGVLTSADATGTSTVIIASFRRNLPGESARRPHLWRPTKGNTACIV